MRIVALVWLAAAGCVPQRNVAVADIPKMDSFDDIMFVQANTFDPSYKKRGHAAYDDADWPMFADTGRRIEATTARLKEKFSKGADFDALATSLQAHATALAAAADGKNAAGVTEALTAMKGDCSGCHKKFR